MKGLRKIESCVKNAYAKIEAMTKEIESHEAKMKDHLASIHLLLVHIETALEEVGDSGESSGTVDIRSFVRQVFHPTAKPKLAEKPDGMINAYYAYCKQHDAEVTLSAPKIKVNILTALREEYSSTQVTYNVEYLTRRLLVNPYFMAKERGISLEETLASTDFDWHAASVAVPWWQVLDSPRVTIQGQEYATMT